MKHLAICMASVLGMLVSAGAGEIIVEIKTAGGEPKAGAKVRVVLEDGHKTRVVHTGPNGVAHLKWKSKAERGEIHVNGATVYSGSIPLRISFSL